MNEADKIVEVLQLGIKLVAEHGLDEWTFDLGNSQRTVGWCKHDTKRIELSLNYIAKTPMRELRDTILHEIAHALVGPNHGHDDTWKRKCIEIGARPERLADETAKSEAKYNYVIECTECGKRWYRYRLRRKSLVGALSACCHAELKFYKIRRGG